MTEATTTLVLWSDPRERRTLYRIISATGAKVFHAPSPDDAPMDRHRLIVLHADSLGGKLPDVLASIANQDPRPAVLLVTESTTREDIAHLLAHGGITNFIAKNTALRAEELIVTVQKILRGDLFGLEKYLAWGPLPHDERLTDSDARHASLDRLERYLEAVGCNRRLIGVARSVGEELLMNAIYHGPIDEDGKPKHASRPRTDRVLLKDREAVLFRYATDGRVLALSASDNFGRIEPTTVTGYLRKCLQTDQNQMDDKEGGAGLGLYYAFESLNSFIINVEVGKRTEMIGLIDISGTYRDYAQKPKSLHLFYKEAQR